MGNPPEAGTPGSLQDGTPNENALFGLQKPWVVEDKQWCQSRSQVRIQDSLFGVWLTFQLEVLKQTEVMLLIFLIFMSNHPGAY